ncbi:MAG: ACT domain-containing protein [Oscillospiraceae bacterium]|nr:ACT domain-containing protein [Oscillospiraceae bacterium]
MTAQQLSIFMENKPGQLVKVTQTLAEAGIDIRAMSLADTKDFGIVRMIVSDCAKAQVLMREKGFMSTITQVMCIAMNDQPGGLEAVTELLAQEQVNIDYLYACITVIGKNAYIVMHVDNEQKADEVLTKAGVRTVTTEELANLG